MWSGAVAATNSLLLPNADLDRYGERAKDTALGNINGQGVIVTEVEPLLGFSDGVYGGRFDLSARVITCGGSTH